jgi:hypothetical protein
MICKPKVCFLHLKKFEKKEGSLEKYERNTPLSF